MRNGLLSYIEYSMYDAETVALVGFVRIAPISSFHG